MDKKDRVIEIVCAHVDMENANQILQESGDITQLGINSITFIKIAVDLETEFNITFEDEALDYNRFISIDLLCEYVAKRME